VTNIDPVRPANIEFITEGKHIVAASGEMLVAPRMDSVNTFEAPHTVETKPIAARASGGSISLRLAPASVTVVSLE
jgi:alpha-N-arabinofuranosidase